MRTVSAWRALVATLACAAGATCAEPAQMPAATPTTCQAYDPASLSVSKPSAGFYSAQQWTITSAGVRLEAAATEADADKVKALASFYRAECHVGGGKDPATYWIQPVKRLAVPFPEDCVRYAPATIVYAAGGIKDPLAKAPASAVGARQLFVPVPGPDEAGALLVIAKRATQACVIGGWVFQPTPDEARDSTLTKEGKFDLEAADEAWHPVYYWNK